MELTVGADVILKKVIVGEVSVGVILMPVRGLIEVACPSKVYDWLSS
jgi:hypothetical protein